MTCYFMSVQGVHALCTCWCFG